MSRFDLGVAVGLSEEEVAAIERGQVRATPAQVRGLAKVFGLPADALTLGPPGRGAPSPPADRRELVALFEALGEDARRALLDHARRLATAGTGD